METSFPHPLRPHPVGLYEQHPVTSPGQACGRAGPRSEQGCTQQRPARSLNCLYVTDAQLPCNRQRLKIKVKVRNGGLRSAIYTIFN